MDDMTIVWELEIQLDVIGRKRNFFALRVILHLRLGGDDYTSGSAFTCGSGDDVIDICQMHMD